MVTNQIFVLTHSCLTRELHIYPHKHWKETKQKQEKKRNNTPTSSKSDIL